MGDAQRSKVVGLSREVRNWTAALVSDEVDQNAVDYGIEDDSWSLHSSTPSSLLSNSSFPNGSSNDANGTATFNYTRDEDLAKVEMAVLALLFILTVLGNCVVLLGIFFRKQKMTRMYYFILHLSFADLITAFFNVLTQLFWEITYRFQGGNFLCKFVKYTQILGPYSSSYVLVMTALDRYQAICYPMSNCTWTAKRSKIMLGLAWAISFLFCVPQIFIFSYQQVNKEPPEFDCWATFPEHWGAKAYVTWYSITVFIIPLIILIFAYSCITRAIWINFNMKAASRNHDTYERRITRQDSDEGDGPSHSEEPASQRDARATHADSAAGKKSLNINLYNPAKHFLSGKSFSTTSTTSTSVGEEKGNKSFWNSSGGKGSSTKKNKDLNTNNVTNMITARTSTSSCATQSSPISPSVHRVSGQEDKDLVGTSSCEQRKNSLNLVNQKMFLAPVVETDNSASIITTTSFTTTNEQHDAEEQQLLHLIPKESQSTDLCYIPPLPPPRDCHSSSDVDFQASGSGGSHMKNGSVTFPGSPDTCQHGCYEKRCNFCHLSADGKRFTSSDGTNSYSHNSELNKKDDRLLRKGSSNSPSPTSFTDKDRSDRERTQSQSYRFSGKSSSRHLLLPGRNRLSRKASRRGSSGPDGKQSVKSSMATYMNNEGPRTHSVKGISRAKIKTIKLTVTIICCYIFCSSPFIAAQLWSVYDPYAYTSSFFTGPTFTILTLLASLNSCVNPYIFLFFNPNLLQNCFQGIFRPKFPTRRFNNGS